MDDELSFYAILLCWNLIENMLAAGSRTFYKLKRCFINKMVRFLVYDRKNMETLFMHRKVDQNKKLNAFGDSKTNSLKSSAGSKKCDSLGFVDIF